MPYNDKCLNVWTCTCAWHLIKRFFTGDYREIMVSSDWVERIRAQISAFGANDFTISAIIKQNPNNVGTILAFSRGLLRYTTICLSWIFFQKLSWNLKVVVLAYINFIYFSALEIQSSGRKNELRVISGSLVETFPFQLADGSWHRLAITFSASEVNILVDCSSVYRRVLKFDPVTAIFNSLNISIWIGQKTKSHFLYQVCLDIKKCLSHEQKNILCEIWPMVLSCPCPWNRVRCKICSLHLVHMAIYNNVRKWIASVQHAASILP